jgi:hypothetical protein
MDKLVLVGSSWFYVALVAWHEPLQKWGCAALSRARLAPLVLSPQAEFKKLQQALKEVFRKGFSVKADS